MYENGYSLAIVLDHRFTATSLTGNFPSSARSRALVNFNMSQKSYNFTKEYITQPKMGPHARPNFPIAHSTDRSLALVVTYRGMWFC